MGTSFTFPHYQRTPTSFKRIPEGDPNLHQFVCLSIKEDFPQSLKDFIQTSARLALNRNPKDELGEFQLSERKKIFLMRQMTPKKVHEVFLFLEC